MHYRAFLVLALGASNALCQSAPSEPAPAKPSPAAAPAQLQDPGPTPAPTQAPEASPWTFSVMAYTYFTDDGDYVQPTITADRGSLHLEARYNYEDRDTGSVWIGSNFNLRFGEEVTWDVTPMIGGVFGETNGVAPGYHSTLGWRKFELYSEGEYVFDTDDSEDSFFYTWSELTFRPVDSLRLGMVIQRTKAYDTDLDVQRGLLIGISTAKLDVTATIFNPDESDPVVMVSLGLAF